jgi:hypothetical protein
MQRWLTYLAVVIVAGIVGLSLTKTTVLQHEHGPQYFLSGALIGLIAIYLYRLLSQRIQESLPTSRQLYGLKVFAFGLLLALVGWLISTFIALQYGIPIVLLGMAIGACGMAYHHYLMFTRDNTEEDA